MTVKEAVMLFHAFEELQIQPQKNADLLTIPYTSMVEKED